MSASLIGALESGDVAAVTRVLEGGADPNEVIGGVTPLGRAVRSRSAAVVQVLIEYGAVVDESYGSSMTALREAVHAGEPGLVRVLLDSGASPNPLTAASSGRTSLLCEALELACRRPSNPSLECLEALLEFGAQSDVSEDAPIAHGVARRALPAVVRLLLSYGNSPNGRTREDVPALVLAAKANDLGIVEILLTAGAAVNAIDGSGWNALMHAIDRGFGRLAAALILAGAEITEVSGGSPATPQIDWSGSTSVGRWIADPRIRAAGARMPIRSWRFDAESFAFLGTQSQYREAQRVLSTALELLGEGVSHFGQANGEGVRALVAKFDAAQKRTASERDGQHLRLERGELRMLRTCVASLIGRDEVSQLTGISNDRLRELLGDLDRHLSVGRA